MKIKKEHMTDDIIKEIMSIDKAYYKKDYTLSWYKERNSKKNIVYCLYDKKDIIGYAAVSGIKKSLYLDIKEGKYKNDYDFDPSMFDINSPYKYLSSINIIKSYRGKGYGYKLLRKVLKKYKNFNLIALAISKGGYHLLSKEMNLVKKISRKTFVFEKISI